MEQKWNFWMTPPSRWEYTKNEEELEMIYAAKAFYVCHNPALALSKCRSGASGKLVHPEKCVDHAKAVYECYQSSKIVPKQCKEVFDSVEKCLKGGYKCDNEMNEYLRCEHPTYMTYEGYH